MYPMTLAARAAKACIWWIALRLSTLRFCGSAVSWRRVDEARWVKGLEFRWCRLRAVIHRWVVSFMLLVLPALAAGTAGPAAEAGPEPEVLGKQPRLEAGQRMYRDGLLPSGERMTGIVSGDIPLSGDQVICGWCHRRSGMGSTEGQEVVPAVTGDMLYNPLRLPTSKPPLAPIQRPAYTDETLKRAIREGVGPDGKPFSALMPRYPLSDEELDILLDYLTTHSLCDHPHRRGP